MANMQIKRIAEDMYAVLQYDEVLSVRLPEMNENELYAHLRLRNLVNRTADDVLGSLDIGEEITVQFRTAL